MSTPPDELLSAFLRQDHAAVVRECGASLARDAECAPAHVNRARGYLGLGVYRAALKDCAAALALDDALLVAYEVRGQVLAAMGRHSDARAAWREGAAVAGGDLAARAMLWRLAAPAEAPEAPEADERPASTEAKPQVGLPAAMAASSVASQGLVEHGVGVHGLDEKIALGYLRVNTGQLADGLRIFEDLLAVDPQLLAAHLGIGTAHALMGDLVAAEADFGRAIKADGSNTDAWKRRGQVRAALGKASAVDDLSRAVALAPGDADAFHQRGLAHHKLRNYRRAMPDFERAVELDPSNHLSWNFLGLCDNSLGNCLSALKAYERAVALQPQFKEGIINLGQANKDWGNFGEARHHFQHAAEIDPTYTRAHHLLGVIHHAVGDLEAAIEHFSRVVALAPHELDSLHLRGVCFHGLGNYQRAVADYEAVLSRDPAHVCWYQRECALYQHERLDRPLHEYNMDAELGAHFKEGWCKRLPPAAVPRYTPFGKPKVLHDVSQEAVADAVRALAGPALHFGRKLQLNSPGFHANRRQHRACGFAVLEMAQTLRAVWDGTTSAVPGTYSSGSRESHTFGYRDLFDIAIKHRQYSEPNDPVWWVDLLSPEQFADGFGSHTPMISGQSKVVRYYPYCGPALRVLKTCIFEQCDPSADARQALAAANTVEEVYSLMLRDFWIVTPCKSLARPGHTLEGTRLTVQSCEPEGFDFAIRTPGTPPRWKEYDLELSAAWDALVAAQRDPATPIRTILRKILVIVFYWFNFMPLSRGSAALGYYVLYATLYATGYEIAAPVPKGLQIDWEAILTPDVDDFVAAVTGKWITEDALVPCTVQPVAELPGLVNEALPTLRALLVAYRGV